MSLTKLIEIELKSSKTHTCKREKKKYKSVNSFKIFKILKKKVWGFKSQVFKSNKQVNLVLGNGVKNLQQWIKATEFIMFI